jgi:hypothetical protein
MLDKFEKISKILISDFSTYFFLYIQILKHIF